MTGTLPPIAPQLGALAAESPQQRNGGEWVETPTVEGGKHPQRRSEGAGVVGGCVSDPSLESPREGPAEDSTGPQQVLRGTRPQEAHLPAPASLGQLQRGRGLPGGGRKITSTLPAPASPFSKKSPTRAVSRPTDKPTSSPERAPGPCRGPEHAALERASRGAEGAGEGRVSRPQASWPGLSQAAHPSP